jgi:Ca-activated chloride channel family protein
MIALGFGAVAAAWLFLLTVPLVALYFLKLRRPELRVPSLCLWRAVLADRRVNSPFQRFKRNLLLWLQLLLLCLCVLAAMLPYARGALGGADRTVLLLDTSASMAARDAGGRSRLELARAAAAAAIAALQPDEQLALIAFARHARLLAPFTSDKAELSRALAALTVEDVDSDLLEPLRMAEAMARAAPVRRVVLVSDGNVPAAAGFDLPYELDYRVLPPAGPNLGITQLRARRRTGGGWSVFAALHGTDGVAAGAAVELRRNGEVIGTEPVVLRSDRSQRLVWTLAAADHGALELRLRHAGADALATDDHAVLRLTPPRDLRVRVDAGLHAWRHAIAVAAGAKLVDDGDTNDLDLVVARVPASSPPAPTRLFDGAMPAGLDASVTIGQPPAGDAAIDWRRDAPLLEHVELGEVVFLDQPTWQPGSGEGNVERLGAEVLVHGRRGPLLVQRATEERSDWYLLGSSERSTLPYRVAFPILVANLLRIAAERAGVLEVAAPRAGVLPAVPMPAGTACEVRAPDGSRRIAHTAANGRLADVPAPIVGRYEVAGDGTTVAVDVALLSADESSLARVETMALRDLRVAATRADAVDVDRPLWATLALLATVVLLVEWWYFHRPVRRHVAPGERRPATGRQPRGMPA